MTAANALRVGVVGVGWAGQQHLAGFARIPGVRIQAIAGMETDRVAELAAKYGIRNRFERWEDMLDAGGLDAVSIAVPTYLHAPITIAALERGLHVLTEKPIAGTIEQAEAMVDAAHAAGRALQVVFNHRERGDIAELRRILDRGELGTPYAAKAGWLRRNGIPGDGSWFTSRERAGGGPLIDLGVHVLDYALYLLGEPQVLTVSASTYSELGSRGHGGRTPNSIGEAFEVEDLAMAFIRLAGGGTLLLEASWAAYRADNDEFWMTLYGTQGGADLRVVDYAEPGALQIYRDSDDGAADYTAEPGKNGGHDVVTEQFVKAVLGGPQEWTKHDGSIGLTRARIIDACYRSAAAGREVVLDGNSPGGASEPSVSEPSLGQERG
jgi:predicted dehydrogenase